VSVIIIGKGEGWKNAPEKGVGRQIWGVNDICLRRPVDLVFNMHDLDKHKKHGLFKKTVEFINLASLPVITQKKYDYIPTSEAFPLHHFAFHRRYFTNSIDYMVAYAWYLNNSRPHHDDPLPIFMIEMYGVVMASGTEYAHQRPSLEYWIGTFEAEGAEVLIHEPTFVCNPLKKGLYGYDWDEEDEEHVKARKENQ
jgi:hypothetical protein